MRITDLGLNIRAQAEEQYLQEREVSADLKRISDPMTDSDEEAEKACHAAELDVHW